MIYEAIQQLVERVRLGCPEFEYGRLYLDSDTYERLNKEAQARLGDRFEPEMTFVVSTVVLPGGIRLRVRVGPALAKGRAMLVLEGVELHLPDWLNHKLMFPAHREAKEGADGVESES